MIANVVYNSGYDESLVWYCDFPYKTFWYKQGSLKGYLDTKESVEKITEWKELPTYSEQEYVVQDVEPEAETSDDPFSG